MYTDQAYVVSTESDVVDQPVRSDSVLTESGVDDQPVRSDSVPTESDVADQPVRSDSVPFSPPPSAQDQGVPQDQGVARDHPWSWATRMSTVELLKLGGLTTQDESVFSIFRNTWTLT